MIINVFILKSQINIEKLQDINTVPQNLYILTLITNFDNIKVWISLDATNTNMYFLWITFLTIKNQ